jgi:hypothetical protein
VGSRMRKGGEAKEKNGIAINPASSTLMGKGGLVGGNSLLGPTQEEEQKRSIQLSLSLYFSFSLTRESHRP